MGNLVTGFGIEVTRAGEMASWFWVQIYRVSLGGNVKRERKDGLPMQASISIVFSLFLFYHFVFFSFVL